LDEAKKLNLIYQDQAFVPGKAGEYPEHMETYRTTKSGLNILLRPVKISDEALLKGFFYSLSDQSMYQRFVSARKDMPHERLQEFVVIDYTKEMAIVAVMIRDANQEEIVGLGQYGIDESTLMANFALVVRDEWQGHGVGKEILFHLANLAKKRGLRGFTAEVLEENRSMFHLFESLGLAIEHRSAQGIHELRIPFKGRDSHEQ
jgi:GNAT superfamily N-acetyltransferase